MFHIGDGWGNTTGKNCTANGTTADTHGEGAHDRDHVIAADRDSDNDHDRDRDRDHDHDRTLAAAPDHGGANAHANDHAHAHAGHVTPAPSQTIHRASSPEGPWTLVTLDGVSCNNPAPFRGSDGVYRLLCDWHMYTSTAGFGGPWSEPLLVPGIASDAHGTVGPGDPARSGRGARLEDPFLWQDTRGHYHVLGHMFADAPCGRLNEPGSVTPSCNFISGHAYSREGLSNWTLSPTEPFSFTLTYAP